MSILRKAFDEKIPQYDERANKAEAEVKKLQGRLGSLIEEKNQLSRKIRSLEVSNKALTDQVEALQSTKDVAADRDLESDVHNKSNDITDRDESEDVTTKENNPDLTEAHSSTNNDHTGESIEYQGTETMNNQESYEELDFVFFYATLTEDLLIHNCYVLTVL